MLPLFFNIHRVIPAKAGIHVRMSIPASAQRIAPRMDSGLRRNDPVEWHA
jgi:hypothetical protein